MPYAPGQTTGFNSVSDYLGANQGTLDREANDVNGMVGSELDAGKTAADQFAQGVTSPDYSSTPGYSDALAKQNTGQQDAELTKSGGGLQDLLGRTPQGHGATAFDGMLLGAHGGFKDTQDKAQTLHGYLDSVSRPSTPYTGGIDQGRTSGGGIGGQGGAPAAQPSPGPTNNGGGDAGPLDTPVPPGGLVPNSGLQTARPRMSRSPSIYGGY